MKLGKILIVAGMIAVGIMNFSIEALATDPPADDPRTPHLPEYWSVVVVDCSGASGSNVAVTLRAKKVVDCDVETQALTYYLAAGNCPDPMNAVAVEGWLLENETLFGETGDPGIYKVRNFKAEKDGNNEETGVYSFDALIRFWKIPNP